MDPLCTAREMRCVLTLSDRDPLCTARGLRCVLTVTLSDCSSLCGWSVCRDQYVQWNSMWRRWFCVKVHVCVSVCVCVFMHESGCVCPAV